MSDPARPFIVMPPRTQRRVEPPPRRRGGTPSNPRKARQVERLGPQFGVLQEALEAKLARLDADPGGVAPEQVLVFETNGPIAELYAFLASTPGLEWLVDEELRDLPPDEDFFDKDDAEKSVSARAYLVLTNTVALSQLLSAWDAWSKGRLPAALAPWREVFARLRQVRRWDVQDRLEETGILDEWRRELADELQYLSPFEVELWERTPAGRAAAAARVRQLVARAEGEVLQELALAPIAYHALLVRLPACAVEQILADRSVELVRNDDVKLFRPSGQAIRVRRADAPPQNAPERAAEDVLREPLIGLLDGLPLANHALLAGRLVVSDPDGWEETYPVASRQHGTEMASLILHGDLNASEAPSSRRLYCRPILRPHPVRPEVEAPPRDRLWVDVIHRAVRGAIEGEGDQPPEAPSVKVFNLSVGHPGQPFIRSMSPLARLLDWLSWKYQVVFVVSAGNHDRRAISLPQAANEPGQIERALLVELGRDHRNRRLLSPAETVNGITVGASHEDAAGTWTPSSPDEVMLVTTRGLPTSLSGLGRGYRRSVKPDLLAPGGRIVFNRGPQPAPDGTVPYTSPLRFRQGPGQLVAAPGTRSGDVRGTGYTAGTSNAAALTSRLTDRICSALEAIAADERGGPLRSTPMALWIKTLLVHTAEWPREAFEALETALRNEENTRTFKDEAAAFLGYGVLRSERATGCELTRATLLGAGDIAPGETWVHRVPLPTELHAFNQWRRLTMTLSWFTPTNPRDQRYRCFALSCDPPVAAESPLRLERSQVHGRAATRGTVQHEVLEKSGGAINLPDGQSLEFPVTCTAEAPGPGSEVRVPYALASTLEVAAETRLPIYDAILERVRPRPPIRPR